MKELKDYIHLYIGCAVMITDEELVKDMIEAGGDGRGVLTGLHGEYGPEFAAFEGHHTSESPEYTWHLKLILRPLESMSDEEKVECDNAGDEAWYPVKFGKILEESAKVHYLLSKGFDLFDLEESGLAVYETDIKK